MKLWGRKLVKATLEEEEVTWRKPRFRQRGKQLTKIVRKKKTKIWHDPVAGTNYYRR